jgi:hypothetical protein
MTVDLEHLEQLEKAATPGEWSVLYSEDPDRPGVYVNDGGFGTLYIAEECMQGPDDAELIVAARNALPSLIADLRRERERNAELVEALRPFARSHILGG